MSLILSWLRIQGNTCGHLHLQVSQGHLDSPAQISVVLLHQALLVKTVFVHLVSNQNLPVIEKMPYFSERILAIDPTTADLELRLHMAVYQTETIHVVSFNATTSRKTISSLGVVTSYSSNNCWRKKWLLQLWSTKHHR